MSTKHLAVTAIAALFASTAIAQEANVASTKSRAEVRHETAVARANGELEHVRSYEVQPGWYGASTKSRAEVRHEAAVARANGELEHVRSYEVQPGSYVATLTRAEVLADLQIYRQSGLAQLESSVEAGPNVVSDEYRRAQARYAALRSSPQFAALVQSIAQGRGESVAVAGSATGLR